MYSQRLPEILVVDDEIKMQELIKDILNNRGYHTRGVGLGRKAIELVRSSRVDVLLLDYKLPDMDGLQVLVGLLDGQELVDGLEDGPPLFFADAALSPGDHGHQRF